MPSYPGPGSLPSLAGQTAPPLGPWLRLLSFLLMVWGPVELALVTASALSALPVRGPLLALVIVFRLGVTAFGIAAGLALVARRPGALAFTRASLLLTAATDTLVYLTPIFPSNRMPGDERWYVGATLLYAAAWLIYLARSRRARQIFTVTAWP